MSCTTPFTVPAGDRSVIQQLETNCVMFPGQSVPNTTVIVSTNGFPNDHSFPLLSEGLDSQGFQIFGNNQAVTYYADAGSELTFTSAPSDAEHTGCGYTLSGYLINYP